jgi:hypothetical protein
MKIEFKNSARNTRGGFAHDTQMFIDDQFEQQATCHYLNRTWESYAFQSVMRQAIYLRIEQERAKLVREYKSERSSYESTKKRTTKSVFQRT